MMRTLIFSALLLAACGSDEPTELGDFLGGKGDVTEIEVPVVVGGNQAEQFVVNADAAFEIELTSTGRFQIGAIAGSRTWSVAEPRLVVDLASGPAQRVQITITNLDGAELRGRLHIGPAAPVCEDGVYLPWVESLKAKLVAAGPYYDQAEIAQLDGFAATRPCASESDAAYLAWFAWFEEVLVASMPYFQEDEPRRLAYVGAAAPSARGDQAYLAWHARWKTTMDKAYPYLQEDEPKWFDQLLMHRPAAEGDAAYEAWAVYTAELGAKMGPYRQEDEPKFLDLLAAAKPCARQTAATQASFAKITQALSAEVLADHLVKFQPTCAQ